MLAHLNGELSSSGAIELQSHLLGMEDQKMLHIVKQIQRHFPGHNRSIIAVAVALSVSALLVGVGLLVLNQ